VSDLKNKTVGSVLDIDISNFNMQETINHILRISKQEIKNGYICICNTHSLVTATKDEYFKKVLENSNLNTPDGMPLVWALRRLGFRKQERVDGPELMLKLCAQAREQNINIYLLGSTEKTLHKLELKLKEENKGLNIVGKYSPPFRELNHEELKEMHTAINASDADIVFVSLGCPKQEKWMYENYRQINSVLIGVGAAFTFAIGEVKRPPLIFQKMGLEWAFRLISEPKRLWKRYLVNNTLYILNYIKHYKNDKQKTNWKKNYE
jgi:N-acetylglucosaminyldiphosphoundecaprenol N-acetyl-beta-D-mannosaminyltransferase